MRLVMINDNTFIIWEPIITSAREPLFIFLRHFRSRLFVTSTVIVKIVHNRIILILYCMFTVPVDEWRLLVAPGLWKCHKGPVSFSDTKIDISRQSKPTFPDCDPAAMLHMLRRATPTSPHGWRHDAMPYPHFGCHELPPSSSAYI